MEHPQPPEPLTPNAEIVCAESPHVASTRTDAERLDLVERELRQGFEALAGLGPAVCVFGSARTPESDPLYAEAHELGRAIGEAGFAVITGGGPGLMEAANRGAQEAGATSVGLNILLPFEQELNPYCDIGLTFDYFFTRKLMFVRYSTSRTFSAFISPERERLNDPAKTTSSTTVTLACMKSWTVPGLQGVDCFPEKGNRESTAASSGIFQGEWPSSRHWRKT